jgi:phosphoribosylglycinamide formyltransferase 1
MKKIGWFTTARGPGSLNLFNSILSRIDSGDIDAQISFLFINRDIKGNQFRTKVVRMAEDHGIPVVIFPSDTFRQDLKERDIDAWRDAYGVELRSRLSRYDIDFGVLAGYMLIFDPETCRKYTSINLHPALPDTYKGTWEEILGQVVDNKDAFYGSTVHLCTPELDRGQPISYDSFPLDDLKDNLNSREELVQAIRGRELKREAFLLMATIKMITRGEIVLKGGEVLGKEGARTNNNPCLSDQIDLEMV